MTHLNLKNRLTILGVFLLLFVGISLTYAQQRERPAEHTSLMELANDNMLRRDFFLQGEYLLETGNTKRGLHLIADGNGRFRCVFYNGGLPGAGWNTGDVRLLGTAVMNGENGLKFEITKADSKDTNVRLPELPFSIDATFSLARTQERPGGGIDGVVGREFASIKMKLFEQEVTFNKNQRRSETFDAKPPAGAVVLFDGTNVNKFKPGANINEAQQPYGPTLWAEATTLPFEQKPYTLHLEFMLSYMPTAQGQSRSNSGVYIFEAYECQVLDSYGLELADNHCGGFYQAKAPDINVTYPPLTWQTYDFDFTPPKYDGDTKVENARITVKHNGVIIHDNLELRRETPGLKREANEPRGIYLQGHGNKVQYRNIWLKYKD